MRYRARLSFIVVWGMVMVVVVVLLCCVVSPSGSRWSRRMVHVYPCCCCSVTTVRFQLRLCRALQGHVQFVGSGQIGAQDRRRSVRAGVVHRIAAAMVMACRRRRR